MEQANTLTGSMSNNNTLDLYAAYLKEREDTEIVSNEHGFATYRMESVDNKPTIYIIDIYVVPHMRKSGLAYKLAAQIENIAKELGICSILGSVDTTANGAIASIKVLHSYGMKECFKDENMIYFIKEI